MAVPPDSVEGRGWDPGPPLIWLWTSRLIAGSDNRPFPSLSGFLGCRGHGPSWDGPYSILMEEISGPLQTSLRAALALRVLPSGSARLLWGYMEA